MSTLSVGKGRTLYGTTEAGGADGGSGTVFEVAPGESGYAETVLHSFPGQAGDGRDPYTGPLVADQRTGAWYGTTSSGGSGNCFQGCGTVFRLMPSGSGYTESVIYNFGVRSNDGTNPYGGLVLDRGDLYGTTIAGGDTKCSCGTVFRLKQDGSSYIERILHSFAGGPTDGAGPEASMIVDATGSLYGMTVVGGSGASGTVFTLTRAGGHFTEKVLYSFRDSNGDGSEPLASLLADSQGNLYGTTSRGGSNKCNYGCGTVFKLAPSGSGYQESVLYAFAGGSDGYTPSSTLIADESGSLYGTTEYGGGKGCGGSGCGAVFELSPAASDYEETLLYRFRGGNDGLAPYAGLIADKRGSLYGTTAGGGSTGNGTVFKLTP